jgi:hypothetical protein
MVYYLHGFTDYTLKIPQKEREYRGMVIRNRLLALIYRVLEACFLIYVLVETFRSGLVNPTAFNYFVTEVDILATVVVLLEIIFNAIDLVIHGIKGVAAYVWMPLTMATLVYAFGDSVIYSTAYPLIYHVYAPQNIMVLTILTHVAVPLVLFLDWLLFDAKGTVKWRHGGYFAIYPAAYFVFLETSHYILKNSEFPYSIFNPISYADQGAFLSAWDGWAGVLVMTAVCLSAITLIGFLFIFLNNLIAGKYRHLEREAGR